MGAAAAFGQPAARQAPNGYPPPDRPARPPAAPSRPGRRADASHWHWLLFVPIVLPLLPPLYNRIEPTFFGLPFFYWCQFMFALLAAITIAIVHVATKDR